VPDELTTRTFLFTDLEGSTRLWEEEPDAMRVSLERHDELVRAAIEAHGGDVFSSAGDSFAAAFATADEAVRAALDAQLSLAAERWTVSRPLKARIGLHTDAALMQNGRYLNRPLNRCSRLMATAHGGQVVWLRGDCGARSSRARRRQ